MRINIIFIVIILISFGCKNQKAEVFFKKSNDDFMLGGIQMNEPDQERWTETLEHIGMNTVSITVYAKQWYWHNDTLYTGLIDEESVIKEIKSAKSKNLNVVFIPRVMLDSYFSDNRFLWHGLISLENDSLLQKWFEAYTSYITHWAKICNELDVDMFALGSELRTLTQTKPITQIPELEEYYINPIMQKEYFNKVMQYEGKIKKDYLYIPGEDFYYDKLENYLHDEVKALEKWAKAVSFYGQKNRIEKINQRRAFTLEQWHKVIEETRKVYKGKLTYAANFDNYHNIAFWDKLDVMGINAYFKLQHDFTKRSEEQELKIFKNSWDDVFQGIISFQEENELNHPVVFTELGYIDKDKCSLAPWQGHKFSIVYSGLRSKIFVWEDQPIDANERVLAMKALYETSQKYDLLKGLLYWKFSTYPELKDEDPFLVILDSVGTDPLQQELLKFVN